MLNKASRVYKPFLYPQFVEQAVTHEQAFWGEWEVSLGQDLNQWRDGTITEAEKYHITQILRLFTQSDVIVGGSYADIFIPYFKNNEVRQALISICNRESTHMRAYALLNDTLGLPDSEYSVFLEYDEMLSKAQFMEDFIPNGGVEDARGMGLNLARTVLNEGVSLFSAFVQLLNYQRPESGSKLIGTNVVVEWSIRDESLHCETMGELFRLHCQENPEIVDDGFKREIYEMYREGVALEDNLIDLTFAKGVTALTKTDLKEYIRYLADRRLTQLGLKPNWDIEVNPLPWVDYIVNGDTQASFFETRVTDYSQQGLKGTWGW